MELHRKKGYNYDVYRINKTINEMQSSYDVFLCDYDIYNINKT